MRRSDLYKAATAIAFVAISTQLQAEEAAEHIARAQTYMNQDDVEKRIADTAKALAEAERAVALDPKSAEAYSARGRAWLFKWEWDKAIADCNKAIELDSKLAGPYLYRADAFMSKGSRRTDARRAKEDFEAALADSNRALAIDPGFAKSYRGRAQVYWKLEMLDKARADFKRAIELDPKDWDTMNNLADADADVILAWVTGPKLCRRWAGGKLSYPLDRQQLVDRFAAARADDSLRTIVKATYRRTGDMAGYVEVRRSGLGSQQAWLELAIVDPACSERGRLAVLLLKLASIHAFGGLGVTLLSATDETEDSQFALCCKQAWAAEYTYYPYKQETEPRWTATLRRVD